MLSVSHVEDPSKRLPVSPAGVTDEFPYSKGCCFEARVIWHLIPAWLMGYAGTKKAPFRGRFQCCSGFGDSRWLEVFMLQLGFWSSAATNMAKT